MLLNARELGCRHVALAMCGYKSKPMFSRKLLISAGLTAMITMGATVPVLAHGPGTATTPQPDGWHQGWHQGWHMGPNMMGQSQMTGPYQGQMPMTGPGMTGQGQMMGPDQGARPGAMQPLKQDLSAADIQHMMEHRLAWVGNPNVKVGKVEEKDGDTIIAEIVTQDGSLVQKLEVDRHTGLMRSVQ